MTGLSFNHVLNKQNSHFRNHRIRNILSSLILELDKVLFCFLVAFKKSVATKHAMPSFAVQALLYWENRLFSKELFASKIKIAVLYTCIIGLKLGVMCFVFYQTPLSTYFYKPYIWNMCIGELFSNTNIYRGIGSVHLDHEYNDHLREFIPFLASFGLVCFWKAYLHETSLVLLRH